MFNHLIQLILCLVLHVTYVIHRQIKPFVEQAEQLSVEVGENASLHLKRRPVCEDVKEREIRERLQEESNDNKSHLQCTWIILVLK